MTWDWVWWIVTVAVLGNGLRLRRRATGLAVLPAPPAGGGTAGPGDDAGWVWLEAEGVDVPGDVRREVGAYARSGGLAVVDVVPGDLPVEQALDFLRGVNPRTFREKRLAPGASALQAMAATADTLERAGWKVPAEPGLDPATMSRAATVFKRYAATATDVVVVPGVRARREDLSRRMGYLQARFGPAAPAAVAVPAALYVLLGVGVAYSLMWGLVALAAWCLQPVVALAGTGLAPRDLWWRPALRWILGPVDLVATVVGRWRPPAGADGRVDPDELRPVYQELLAQGTEPFFEAARPDCPLCGSGDLSERIRTPDLLQHKPGRFVLTRCAGCGHVFQNPRLSLRGLDFYYRDFYDGLGQEQLEFVFGASDTAYRGRAAMLEGRHRPERWIDVGAGHGHFCLVAREHWPDTRFDGLDMSESIEEAERRGWVDTGYRGMLPDLAGGLAGRYDVVSMHHYLEHTREPLEELDAARLLLVPGGHLLIELPDPQSVYGRLLGKYWVPWFQPQHQHLLSVGNLTRAVEDRGLEVVAVERGVAAQPVDLLFAVWFLANRLAPAANLPWLPPTRWYHRVRRGAVMVVALPFFVGALIADNLLAVFVRRSGRSNTYRLLARVP